MWIQIITHTPLWVWGLLSALLVLGLWQGRERRVRPFQLLLLPAVLLPAVLMAMGLWPLALIFGLLSGLFLGRALGLYALTRPAARATAAVSTPSPGPQNGGQLVH